MTAFAGSAALSEAVAAAIEEKVSYALSLSSSDDRWSKMWEKEGIVGCQRAGEVGGTVCVRGQATLPYTPLDIFTIAQRRVELDDHLTQFDILKKETPDTFFDRVCMKAIWPVAERDCVNVSHFRQLDDRTVLCISFSHPDGDSVFPPKKGFVRAHCNIVGYILRPVEGGTHCTYLLETDPKGSIPAVIKTKVTTKQPLILAEIVKQLQADGAPIAPIIEADCGPGTEDFARAFNKKDSI